MDLTGNMKTILAFVGAVVGGGIGFFITGWLARQNLYSVLIPGALVGMGTLIGRFNNAVFPLIVSLLAVALVYYTEWSYFPFSKDQSLSYFVNHLHSLRPLTHIMAGIGWLIAFWLPFRNRSKSR